MLTKAELKANLLKLREDLCVYKAFKEGKWAAARYCKCHYGADNPGRSQSGSGCPEVLDVIHLLENMTDREFNYIAKRSRKPKAAAIESTEPAGC